MKVIGELKIDEENDDVILSDGKSLKEISGLSKIKYQFDWNDYVIFSAHTSNNFCKVLLSASIGMPIVNGALENIEKQRFMFDLRIAWRKSKDASTPNWNVAISNYDLVYNYVNDGKIVFDNYYSTIEIGLGNHQYIVTKPFSQYNIYVVGKGEVFKKPLRLIQTHYNSELQEAYYYVERKQKDNSIVCNYMNKDLKFLSDEWFLDIKTYTQSCMRSNVRNVKNKLFPNSVVIKKYTPRENDSYYELQLYAGYCLDGEIKLFDYCFNEIKFPNHNISEIKSTSLGSLHRVVIIDTNGNLNFIDNNYKPLFDEKHWIQSKNKSIIYLNGKVNFIDPYSMKLVFKNFADKIKTYKFNHKGSYPQLIKTDKVDSADVIFTQNENGKFGIVVFYAYPHVYISYDGFDNILESNDYFYVEYENETYLVNPLGNFVKGGVIIGHEGQLFDKFILIDKKWHLFESNLFNISVYDMGFDDIYDIESRYVIVKNNGKYNYFDVHKNVLVFDEWFDDVDVYDEDNETFNVLKDGKWNIIKKSLD